MKVDVIVPVRLESSRLHQKALAEIEGLPMFVHTCKRSELASNVDSVYLATDSERIADVARQHNIPVIMTSTRHANSSERIAEACSAVDGDIIVNIQGDEPLVYPDHIDQVLTPILKNQSIDATIGISAFDRSGSHGDIKAAIGTNGQLLYASRNDIPCFYNKNRGTMWKLCFIVPFRREIALKYAVWEPTELEMAEDNHFLRAIENGVQIQAVKIKGAQVSVDTNDDLEEIRFLMKSDKIKLKYVKQSY